MDLEIFSLVTCHWYLIIFHPGTPLSMKTSCKMLLNQGLDQKECVKGHCPSITPMGQT